MTIEFDLVSLDEIQKKLFSDDFVEKLLAIPDDKAAVFENDEALIVRIRALLYRKGIYAKFRTFTDDKHFYVAKKGADKK